ncbi:60S ribosomal protein L7-3 [Acorus calamus]|uniref:60S ribosomal protein L7-3 n=1 Tax=Acorus calamus TaxID=4465 RepID=A0AAV9E9Q2_ACOCL|nr:60S ribosomal protein L7-3 [Acorus calamus]
MVDPGLESTKKSKIFWATKQRTLPTASKLYIVIYTVLIGGVQGGLDSMGFTFTYPRRIDENGQRRSGDGEEEEINRLEALFLEVEQYAKEYDRVSGEGADSTEEGFHVSPEAKLLFIIRIRG